MIKKRDRAKEMAERKSLREEIRYKEKPPRFERKKFLTDAEQRKINFEIDARYRIELESKRYKPGDPEFGAVAVQCTPPHRIKGDSVVDGYELHSYAPKMWGGQRIG